MSIIIQVAAALKVKLTKVVNWKSLYAILNKTINFKNL
jgi:hypothetical protein